ncbi:unnamed protein product [Heligmosomoides polygyrus]|uniref:Reverse transcriptase domain-containing protein n=1 Tax=Heligmosomoides polygyrus TaxID=6339 RepID=A0A3P8BZS1_HELPZ|nr:unnamed protein product [Heligmosomoides polygyrus]
MTKPWRRKIEKQTWLWTDDVKKKVKEEKRLYHAFLSDKTADNWRMYQEAKRTRGGERQLYRLAKARHRQSEDIEKFFGINDENGHLLMNRKRAMERWHDYFERISTVEFAHPPIPRVPPTHGPVQKITVEETEAALKKMKPGKATGPDDIAAELCNSRCWNPAEWLTKFFNQVVAEEKALSVFRPQYRSSCKCALKSAWTSKTGPAAEGFHSRAFLAIKSLRDDATVRGRDAKCLRDATVQTITDVWNDNRSTTALLTQKINEDNSTFLADLNHSFTEKCSYETGVCTLQDGSALLWTPSKEEPCRYAYVTKMKGHTMDCVKDLITSDQGYVLARLLGSLERLALRCRSRPRVGSSSEVGGQPPKFSEVGGQPSKFDDDTDRAGDTMGKLCPAAAGFNCCPLENRGSDDNKVDANEEEGLEHEEELVDESVEEVIVGITVRAKEQIRKYRLSAVIMLTRKTPTEPLLSEFFSRLLLHKDMVDKLGHEVELFENDCLDRLYSKVAKQGQKARIDATLRLETTIIDNDWYVPAASILPYEDMSAEHKDLLATQHLSQRFSPPLCHGDRIYLSAYYRMKPMDTIQHCVYMENDDGEPSIRIHRGVRIPHLDL